MPLCYGGALLFSFFIPGVLVHFQKKGVVNMERAQDVCRLPQSAVLVQMFNLPFRIPGVGTKPPKNDSTDVVPGTRLIGKINKRITIRRVLCEIKNRGLSFREAYYNSDMSVCTVVFAASHSKPESYIPLVLKDILHGTFHQCYSVWGNPRQNSAGEIYRMDCILLSRPTDRRRPQREVILQGEDYKITKCFS